MFLFFKQKTAYEMRISDWSSDVCSSDLEQPVGRGRDDAGVDPVLAAAVPPVRDAARDQVMASTSASLDLPASMPADWRDYFALLKPRVMKIGRASCRERVCQYV